MVLVRRVENIAELKQLLDTLVRHLLHASQGDSGKVPNKASSTLTDDRLREGRPGVAGAVQAGTGYGSWGGIDTFEAARGGAGYEYLKRCP